MNFSLVSSGFVVEMGWRMGRRNQKEMVMNKYLYGFSCIDPAIMGVKNVFKEQ